MRLGRVGLLLAVLAAWPVDVRAEILVAPFIGGAFAGQTTLPIFGLPTVDPSALSKSLVFGVAGLWLGPGILGRRGRGGVRAGLLRARGRPAGLREQQLHHGQRQPGRHRAARASRASRCGPTSSAGWGCCTSASTIVIAIVTGGPQPPGAEPGRRRDRHAERPHRASGSTSAIRAASGTTRRPPSGRTVQGPAQLLAGDGRGDHPLLKALCFRAVRCRRRRWREACTEGSHDTAHTQLIRSASWLSASALCVMVAGAAGRPDQDHGRQEQVHARAGRADRPGSRGGGSQAAAPPRRRSRRRLGGATSGAGSSRRFRPSSRTASSATRSTS